MNILQLCLLLLAVVVPAILADGICFASTEVTCRSVGNSQLEGGVTVSDAASCLGRLMEARGVFYEYHTSTCFDCNNGSCIDSGSLKLNVCYSGTTSRTDPGAMTCGPTSDTVTASVGPSCEATASSVRDTTAGICKVCRTPGDCQHIVPASLTDPHLRTFRNHKRDYNGECDLVLIHQPDFESRGLYIHIRTTIQGYFSFIQFAAIRIGDQTLQIDHKGKLWADGKQLDTVPEKFAGYELTASEKANGMKTFEIALSEDHKIVFRAFHMMLSVYPATQGHFSLVNTARGILGSPKHDGHVVSRDGTKMDSHSAGAIAREWQVRSADPQLFVESRAPQYPDKCVMPDDRRRLLRASKSRIAEAKKLCESSAPFESECVTDILATGSTRMVEAFVGF